MCKVSFYTNNDYGGDETSYDGPTQKKDLPTDIFNGFDSLKTYDNSWLIIFDGNDYNGCSKKYYPNQKEPDLAKVDTDVDDNNWKNDVRSFILYDKEPSSWKLGFDYEKFKGYYQDQYDDSTSSGTAFGYQTQDAKYRIYKPQISYPDDRSMVVQTKIDNKNATQDDHLYLSITFDTNGIPTQIEYSADYADGKYIPKTFVLTVDIIIALVGVELALETGTLSLAEAAATIEKFNKCVKYYNDFIDAIQRFTDVDGGKFYLTSVGIHALTKMFNSVIIND